MNTYITGTGQKLTCVHDESVCEGTHCPIHNLSDHPLRDCPTHWRDDRGLMERICIHGVGHPDPDDINPDHVHGCDGCCLTDEQFIALQWQLRGYDHTPSRLRRFLERIGLVKRP